MARYWVTGGNGNFNSTTNWASSSGGTSGASVPDNTHSVFFDANSGSGTATVNASSTCLDLDFTGFTGTFAGSSALAVSGALTVVSGMVFTYSGTLTLNATSGTKSITTNGVSLPCTIHCNGSGGTWSLADDFTTSVAFAVDVGTFTANSKAMTCASFVGNFAGTKSITLDNSTVTITGTGTVLVTTAASLTWSAAGSTFKFTNSSGTSRSISVPGATLGVVQVTAGTGTVQFGNFTATDVDFTGFTGTWGATLSGTNNILGSLTLGTGMATATGGGAGITFGATSGTKTITSNGVSIAKTITFDGVGGTWQLADALLTTNSITLTNGTFDSNAKSIQSSSFASNGSATRTLTITNTTWTITGSGTCWNLNPFTNGTLNASGSLIVVDNSADNSARTVATATGVVLNDVHFIGTGTGNVTAQTFSARDVSVSFNGGGSFAGCAVARTLDFTGFVGAWTGTAAVALSGNLLLVSGMSISGTFTSPITLNDTSGTTRTITTAGKTITANVTFDGVGGVWHLADALTTTGTITLTNGALSTLGFAVQCIIFSSSNSNTRTLDITNTTITLVPSTVATAWVFGTVTGLTFVSAGSRVVFRGSSTGNIGFSAGGLTYNDVEYSGSSSDTWAWAGTAPTFRDIFVTNTGGGTWLGSVNWVARHVDFTGFTGTWSSTNAGTFTGNFTFSTGMTRTNTGALIAAGTGTQTITSHGGNMGNLVTVNCTGTVQLADDFVATGLSSATFALQSGTFTTNGHAMTVTAVALGPTSATTRTLNLGASVVTLSGTGNVWTVTNNPGALTINAGTSQIVMNDASSSAKTFAGSSFAYYDLTIGGAGTGTFTVSGSNTFHKLEVDTPPHTVLFTIGTTQTIARLVALGTAGNLNTLKSTSAGTQATLSKPNNNVTEVDYCNVQDLAVTGGARWFMGKHSVNVSGNNGQRFTDASNRFGFGDMPMAA